VSNEVTNGARRLMLVDDDGVCLAMLTRGLEKRGFQVSAFSDPRDAMQSLAALRPIAVITDMRMPHMSGLEVVQEVKARLGAGAPPVLVVSAEGDESILQEAFRVGAVDYLLKPVSEVELGVKLERALRHTSPLGLTSIAKEIGAWKLEECIGRGGTACVFRASRGGDDVRYALKVVWPHLTGNTETLLRFRREIDTLADLDHPRLVRFVESGRQGDYFFYVMSHVEGGTLRSRIREEGPQTAAVTLDLIEKICDPLAYMHGRGLVHRDVKPSNIFFTAGDVKLGDFGLAKRLLDRGITLSEEFIGTPLYLAPEVFKRADFDPSVDLYSLGVCAVEMLLGRAPFEEPDSIRLIGTIIDRGLPSPSDLLDDHPPALTGLLERMLAYLPEDRIRSAAELVLAVRATREALS